MIRTKCTVETFRNSKLPRLGKYVLIDFHGKDTIRGANVHTGQEVICKVFHISYFLESLSACMHVPAHPHLNQVIDKVFEDTTVYVFFKHYYGDLHSYLLSFKRIKEDVAIRLFYQIVSVVAHCHENNVIINNLKLKRFIFCDEERLCLKLDTLENAGVLRNAGEDLLCLKHNIPIYMSPETMQEGALFSGRAADVWCLGVILFTLLVGHYPFNDTDANHLKMKIQSGRFNLPERLSSKAKCLICNILRVDPKERLTAREILDHPWFLSGARTRDTSRGCNDQMVPNIC